MFNIVKLLQAAIACSIFSMASGHGIMEEQSLTHRALAEKEASKVKAKNADEGLYKSYVSNKDANVQFEKGFFPYDPGEAYTGHYWQGKIFCFVLMFLAEIGDKTFIIVMVTYTDLGACATFLAGYITLCAMHILGSTLGWGISFIIPAFWTKLIATILFILIAIAMFVMAAYNRHPEAVDTAMGKKGHSVTVAVKEEVPVADDAQKEGGDSDKSGSDHSGSGDDDDDSDSDKKSASDKSDKKSSSDKSEKKSSHKSSSEDSGSGSEHSGSGSEDSDSGSEDSADSEESDEEEVRAVHLPKMTRKATVQVISPEAVHQANREFLKKQEERKQLVDTKTGLYVTHHDDYKEMVLTGKKLQNFCCCGASKGVLFVMMLVAGEMCDKTQIIAVTMAPNYGFQSIVIGGIFAQFFSVGLAIFCAQALGHCIHNRFALDILAGLMFLIFGLYELIGELIMENSSTWAERKV